VENRGTSSKGSTSSLFLRWALTKSGFAEKDIKLFVKLPSWFEVDTPVGKYSPD